jgi:hypothetical protein
MFSNKGYILIEICIKDETYISPFCPSIIPSREPCERQYEHMHLIRLKKLEYNIQLSMALLSPISM